MVAWVLRRGILGFWTLFMVISITFMLLRTLPGGPFDRDRKLPPQVMHNINAQYQLDKPLLQQYTHYLGQLARGNLGPSYKYPSRSVLAIITEAMVPSFLLGGASLLLGFTAGILAALGYARGNGEGPYAMNDRRARLSLERITRALYRQNALLATLALATPSFIMAGGCIMIFSLWLGWLPAALLETPAHWVLPVLAMSATPFAFSFFIVSTSLSQVLQSPFMQMKQASGLPSKLLVIKHALRYALLPFVAMLGPLIASQVTGSFAVESIFAIPGLGRHFVTAVSNRDYTLVMGVTILFALLLVVLNTLAELLYGVLDPRLRHKEAA